MAVANSTLSVLHSLNLPFFMIAIVGAISNDDVIEESDAHQAAGILDSVCEVVVHTAGFQTA